MSSDKRGPRERKRKPYSMVRAFAEYGIGNIFRSSDLYLAVAVGVMMTVLVLRAGDSVEPTNLSGLFLTVMASLGGAVIGTVLAAFAIISSFSEPKFVLFLMEAEGALSDIVALFWFVGVIAALGITFSLFGLVIVYAFPLYLPVLLFLSSSFGLYALFSVVGLIGTVGKVTLARAEYYRASAESNNPEE